MMTDMLTDTPTMDGETLEREVRARRLWYHPIELSADLSTRFPEDYELNPVLESVDAGTRRLVAQMDAWLPVDLGGTRVLDLGCADGLFSFWASRRNADAVLGIERNRYNYERACWLANVLQRTNVEFRCGALERELPDGLFEHVFCVGLLYHLIDPLGTLRLIRQHCRGNLVLASAVDLPVGNGDPMSRLDRYATGAHGLWSFNVPMIRQLILTAGFRIEEEVVHGPECHQAYYALASSSRCAEHHIFEDEINQEFPINIQARRDHVRRIWTELATTCDKPIALFGAGTHTPWLLDQVCDLPKVEVCCVLDDRPPPGASVAGLPVRRPSEVDVRTLSAVVISSWHQSQVLSERASELFSDRVTIIRLDDPASP